MFEGPDIWAWDPERLFSCKVSTLTLYGYWPNHWPNNVDIIWKDFVIPEHVSGCRSGVIGHVKSPLSSLLMGSRIGLQHDSSRPSLVQSQYAASPT
jgi:hypothetical protein